MPAEYGLGRQRHVREMQSRTLLSTFRQRLVGSIAALVIAKHLRDPHIKISHLGFSQSVDGRSYWVRMGERNHIELILPIDELRRIGSLRDKTRAARVCPTLSYAE